MRATRANSINSASTNRADCRFEISVPLCLCVGTATSASRAHSATYFHDIQIVIIPLIRRSCRVP